MSAKTIRLADGTSVSVGLSLAGEFRITVDDERQSPGDASTAYTYGPAQVHMLAAAIEEIACRMDPPGARPRVPFDPGVDR